MHTIIVNEKHPPDLVTLLARELPASRKKAKRLLDRRNVFVNRRRVWMARHVLKQGDRIEVQEKQSVSASTPTELYADDHCLVMNKPSDLLTVGPDSLETRLQAAFPSIRAAHRLDRDTTGCVILARDERAKALLIELFKRHAVTKIYQALVLGQFPDKARDIRAPLDGRSAQSHIRRLAHGPLASLCVIQINTGRTHQIRRHLATAGFPVIGDRQYLHQPLDAPILRQAPRQMLHVWKITFHPAWSSVPIHCTAPVPKDFQVLCRNLGIRR